MKCLDDCHNYQMETFMQSGIRPILQFYQMKEDGTKLDGVTNEEVINVLLHRLVTLNKKMPCRENALAITKLEEALMWLQRRTVNRVARGVEGTFKP